jgi:nucleotide-binding universal stress UspA family protein
MGNVVLSVTLCLLAVTVGHVAAGRIGFLQSEASAVPHSILAILDRADTAHPVLAAAAFAAGGFGSTRIEALHVRHDALEGFMPTEDVMIEERRQEIEGEAARLSAELRAIFDTWRAGGGVGEWREVTGETDKVIAREAAEADLIVIGHGTGRHKAEAQRAVHVALFVSRLTTLLVPAAVPVTLGRSVAIAWKPSDAANRAVAAALPLLMNAERVSVLIETGDGDAAPEELLGKLQRAGVAADVVRFLAEGQSIGEALIARAHAVGADLLVMGAYSHGRLTELILGGATREVLAAADLPVLMHH